MFYKRAISIVKELKDTDYTQKDKFFIPVLNNGKVVARLEAVSNGIETDDFYVNLFADWRRENEKAYPTVFKVTFEGTKKWIKSQLIEREDRVLFFIVTMGGEVIGHIGLMGFDPNGNISEIDNVVRGTKEVLPGIMTDSLRALSAWAKEELGVEKLVLKVFKNNGRAVRLYERCGFNKSREIPLHKEQDGEVIKYKEIPEGEKKTIDRIFLLMEKKNTI